MSTFHISLKKLSKLLGLASGNCEWSSDMLVISGVLVVVATMAHSCHCIEKKPTLPKRDGSGQ